MDDNTVGNKRNSTNSSNVNSPQEIEKMDWDQQNAQASTSSPKKITKKTEFSLTKSSSSIDNKMNNIAKLRQQFVEEVKDMELSLKETIKNLKLKISKTNKVTNQITEELREMNKLSCNQSEIIYNKEQENKVLRMKVEELYEYQKEIFENMEDISNTLNSHENISDQLTNYYNSVLVVQQNNIKMLEELENVTPDEKLLMELNQINLKIKEQEKEYNQIENENSKLELEIKTKKIHKEKQQQEIAELDKKISELETRNKITRQNANKKKINLLSEIEKLKQEVDIQTAEEAQLDKTILELQVQLEESRKNENEIKSKTQEINNEIHLLELENEEYDKMRYKDDQENSITLDKLKEQLKDSKSALVAFKKKENQATTILQKKKSELRTKLKSYESLEQKIKEFETQIKKEEEAIKQLNKECENKRNEYNDKIILAEKNLNEIITQLSNTEQKNSEYDNMVKSLQKEIQELNEKLGVKLKAPKKNVQTPLSTRNIRKYDLPDLFASEEISGVKKPENRKMLYTPTLEDDDLEIDALSLEEQFTHLTQSKPSSPEKPRKFFKHSSLSQSKAKKESTPRNKGRGKKY